MRSLITDGVADSDVILVLATKLVFSRPWCLLEMNHASTIGTPVLLIEIKGGGFAVGDAAEYVANLESEMGRDNPEGLEMLKEHLGDDLKPMQDKVGKILEVHRAVDVERRLTWNPQASDVELIASLKDIAEAMAAVTSSVLRWKGDIAKKAAPKTTRRRSSTRMTRTVTMDLVPVMHITCNVRARDASNLAGRGRGHEPEPGHMKAAFRSCLFACVCVCVSVCVCAGAGARGNAGRACAADRVGHDAWRLRNHPGGGGHAAGQQREGPRGAAHQGVIA